MNIMAGEIGKWMVGDRQVGGFRGWTAIIYKDPPLRSIVRASGFWMLEEVDTLKMVAFFYGEEGEGLKLVRKREAIVNLPANYELDKLILESVEMTFEEAFDWRELE